MNSNDPSDSKNNRNNNNNNKNKQGTNGSSTTESSKKKNSPDSKHSPEARSPDERTSSSGSTSSPEIIDSSMVPPHELLTDQMMGNHPPSMFPDLPYQINKYRSISSDNNYFSQLYHRPLLTTLSSFSQVANLVRNPYEVINHVDEFVRHATSSQRHPQGSSDQARRNLSSLPISPTSPTIGQEMQTIKNQDSKNDVEMKAPEDYEITAPVPTLPVIESKNKRGRILPLKLEEFMNNYQEKVESEQLALIERVYLGGIDDHQVRAAVWPFLLGIIDKVGFFKTDGDTGKFRYLEASASQIKWDKLKQEYTCYLNQWKYIKPDQEARFSTYRERKSLIERDIVRCDRLHPFFCEGSKHLETLTTLLMTYMMYDFDIGYVQGMSDLAGPILYVFNGDPIKSFWVFVKVMELFRRNFEYTQKTIQFQLSCLFRLVQETDPIFAQYLVEKDCSNCFFVFRAIVCQFKRELMREDEDDYTNVLRLWDIIWCVNRRNQLEDLKIKKKIEIEKRRETEAKRQKLGMTGFPDFEICENQTLSEEEKRIQTLNEQYAQFNIIQADAPRTNLTNQEIFTLALCLSMIRRERDIVLSRQLDGTDINRHFIDTKIASDLEGFIEHACNIYTFLKEDFDLSLLTRKQTDESKKGNEPDKPDPKDMSTELDGYDLVRDYLIINAASGN